MKSLGTGVLKASRVSLFLLLLSLTASAQAPDGRQWGEAVGGVQISISDAGFVREGIPKLRVTFRNLNDEDANLYLGFVGGSAPRPCDLEGRSIPCDLNFVLNLTDGGGNTRKLKFKGIAFVAGRLDPYIVWLRAGSTYDLEVGLDQFWSPETGEYDFSLAPGRYRVSLEFEGRDPSVVNLDQPHIKKMSFWKGELRSNTLAVER